VEVESEDEEEEEEVVENPDLIDGAAWAREYRLQMEDLVRGVMEQIETREIKEESAFFRSFVLYLILTCSPYSGVVTFFFFISGPRECLYF